MWPHKLEQTSPACMVIALEHQVSSLRLTVGQRETVHKTGHRTSALQFADSFSMPCLTLHEHGNVRFNKQCTREGREPQLHICGCPVSLLNKTGQKNTGRTQAHNCCHLGWFVQQLALLFLLPCLYAYDERLRKLIFARIKVLHLNCLLIFSKMSHKCIL